MAMFDVGHGELGQAERMHLRHRGLAGDVEHADQLAVRIEDR